MSNKRGIGTFDFETDPFEYGKIPKPFLGVYYDERGPVTFWGPDCAKRIANHIKLQNRYVLAHNGGKFDNFFILPYWDDLEPFIISGRIAQMQMGQAIIRDSFCILPTALKNINKEEIEIWKMHKDHRENYKEEIIRYCQKDCIYLHDAVKEFYDLYGPNLTLAGTAFKLNKKEFGGNKISTMSFNTDAKFRPFYYGGRTQAIRPGVHKGNFTYIDLNSAYPWAMKHCFHPATNSPLRIRSMNLKIMERCFFKVFAKSKGALPFRGKDGSLNFPSDNEARVFYVTGWELKAGIETDTVEVLEVLDQYYFKEVANFSDYVDHFFKMKQEAEENGDDFRRLLAKLLMNALYGRYAIDVLKQKDYKILNEKEYFEELDNNPLANPGHIIWPGKRTTWTPKHYMTDEGWNEIPKFQNVATAASITGCVRALLWRSLLKTKNPVYCDTDSIICEDVGDLEISKDLGAWGIEAENITEVCIGGKKLYSCFRNGEPIKKKLASKGAKLNHDEIRRISKGEEILYKFDAPSFSISGPPKFVKRRIKKTGK